MENNLRFPGQYEDKETGWHYNWNRYYEPGVGRYLRVDPIGFKGGFNLFLYALNNPTIYLDNLGLEHKPGGPYHPPDGVSIGCKRTDSCTELSKKMNYLKHTIDSHINWDKDHDTDRHSQDINELQNAYNTCVAIHQDKCSNKQKEKECECEKTATKVVATTAVVGTTVIVIYKLVKICILTAAGGPAGFAVGVATP